MMKTDISKLKGTFFEEMSNAIGVPLCHVEGIRFETDDRKFVPAFKKAGYEQEGDCEQGWYLKGTSISVGYDNVRVPVGISAKDIAFIDGLIDDDILCPKAVELSTSWARKIRIYRFGKGSYMYSKEDRGGYLEDLERIEESKKKFHEAGLAWNDWRH